MRFRENEFRLERPNMKIHVIAPIVLDDRRPASGDEYIRAARADCEVEVVSLDRGPASIESEYEEAIAAPDTIVKAKEAEAKGADAVVISCMLDPGIRAARELVSIPVLGPCEVSMHIAAMLGRQFSIITVLDRLLPPLQTLARLYGFSDHMASIRSINVPVLDLRHGADNIVQALFTESRKALEQDKAEVVILGCTGMAGMARTIHDKLLNLGYDSPVIDPGIAALKMAEALVEMRLSHSKITYPFPPKKLVVGY